MLYRRLMSEGVKAARIRALAAPGTPGAATAAVLQARARLEAPARPRLAAGSSPANPA